MDSEKFATSVEDRFLQLYMVVSTGGQGGTRHPPSEKLYPPLERTWQNSHNDKNHPGCLILDFKVII